MLHKYRNQHWKRVQHLPVNQSIMFQKFAPVGHTAALQGNKQQSFLMEALYGPQQRGDQSLHSLPQPSKLFNHCSGDCKFREASIFQHKCDNCSTHDHPWSHYSEQKKKSDVQAVFWTAITIIAMHNIRYTIYRLLSNITIFFSITYNCIPTHKHTCTHPF